MLTLTFKATPQRALMVARTKEDLDTLNFLYNNHIMWGFYKLWLTTDHIDEEDPELFKDAVGIDKDLQIMKALKQKYTDLLAVGFINSPKGFVEDYKKSKITEAV